jgi:hypothetical protein
MADNIYGYQDDEVSSGNGLKFGLNAGCVRLVKFEWINDAGKDNAEMEALDIHFQVDGADRAISFRRFPMTKAFGNGAEIVDPKHPAFKKAIVDYNAILTHIMHCFVDKEVLQQSLATPVGSFKEFCKVLMSLLPEDYSTKPLDIFVQYQWQMTGENKRTYLEIPKKMSYGKWLCPEVKPVGKWTEKRLVNPDNGKPVAMWYVDDAGNTHPFKRNGWFVNSNFATQQVSELEQSETTDDDAPTATTDTATNWGKEEATEEVVTGQSWDELAAKSEEKVSE